MRIIPVYRWAWLSGRVWDAILVGSVPNSDEVSTAEQLTPSWPSYILSCLSWRLLYLIRRRRRWVLMSGMAYTWADQFSFVMTCWIFEQHVCVRRPASLTLSLHQAELTTVQRELRFVLWIPGLSCWQIKGGLTHGFVVEFVSKADRDYYIAKDPAHAAFVKKNSPRFEDVKVVDYEKGVYWIGWLVIAAVNNGVILYSLERLMKDM